MAAGAMPIMVLPAAGAGELVIGAAAPGAAAEPKNIVLAAATWAPGAPEEAAAGGAAAAAGAVEAAPAAASPGIWAAGMPKMVLRAAFCSAIRVSAAARACA